MGKRIAAIVCLAAIAIALGGCTKCGFVWDDGPRACHSDKAG